MSEPDTRRRTVIADSLGVGIATGAYGISFGALGTSAGLDVAQTCALSLLAFTGASQFAFIGVVASGGAPLTGALTSVLLGSRNLFYGVSLAAMLRLRGIRRLLGAHLVIDESTAMAVAQTEPRLGRLGFWWTGLSIFLLWNLTTFAGALAGTAIGDPRAYGLDAAVGAAFLGLLWPRLRTRTGRGVALLAAAVALVLVPWSPAGVPIIVGGAVAVLTGLLGPRRSGP
ncbi:AzlC family ABC transporter permease [Aeromicrobium sp. CTD01-1L150]|uniref:AzlC family ABC transporter permease n=1 Tax=Aeromicrobium sp. CTD01-1L150 TaxID=3341830 RepID=UPI0035C0EC4B